MAVVEFELKYNQYTAIEDRKWSTMLVLPLSLGISKKDTVKGYALGPDNVRNGFYFEGLVSSISAGLFYNLPKTDNQYYITNLTFSRQMWIPKLFNDQSNPSHTGNTTNTILLSFEIEANTIQQYDTLRMLWAMRASNNANTKTWRVYANTSISLSGALLMATYSFSTMSGNNGFVPAVRNFNVLNSSTSTVGVNSTAVITSDESVANNASNNNMSIDWTVKQYIIVAVQLNNSADTAYLPYIYGLLYR